MSVRLARPWALGLILLLAVILVACGGSGNTTTSASPTTTGGPGGTTTAQVGAATTAQVGATTTASGSHTDASVDEASPAQNVLDRVYPSVVNIVVQATVQGQRTGGVGSGIVYTSDGYILTNDHVVTLDGNVLTGQTITVNLSTGESLPATLVGRDSAKDVAVVKVNRTGMQPVTFAPSNDVQLAEWAIVIGSPLDYRNSVSLGIISGLNRSFDLGNGQTLSGLVQMDAAVSPGNSGGGCFDANAHFVGMPEIYLPPGQTGAENISFAIPSDVVLSVAKTIVGK
jgi:S1-C subfamily serine protease